MSKNLLELSVFSEIHVRYQYFWRGKMVELVSNLLQTFLPSHYNLLFFHQRESCHTSSKYLKTKSRMIISVVDSYILSNNINKLQDCCRKNNLDLNIKKDAAVFFHVHNSMHAQTKMIKWSIGLWNWKYQSLLWP